MLNSLQTDKSLSTAEALAKLQAEEEEKRKLASQNSHPNPALSEVEAAAYTDDDLRKLTRTSLVMMIHAHKGDLKALGAIREALDRLDGKPVQKIDTPAPVTNNVNMYGIPPEVQERILRQQLERMERQRQMVIEHKA
jgi:hypothetical protein